MPALMLSLAPEKRYEINPHVRSRQLFQPITVQYSLYQEVSDRIGNIIWFLKQELSDVIAIVLPEQ